MPGIYKDSQFASLYPVLGNQPMAAFRLALVSVMQFLEGLVFSAGG